MTSPKPWEQDWEPAPEPNWRGDQHLEDWPENLAGPEYWLYKKKQKEEEQ